METEEEKIPAEGVHGIGTGVEEVQMEENVDEARGVEMPRFRNGSLDLSSEKGTVERGNSRFTCPDCSRDFPSKRALGSHNRAHNRAHRRALPPSSLMMVDSSAGSFSLEDREASPPPPRHLKRWRTTPNTIGAPATGWRSGCRKSFANKKSPEAGKALTGGSRGTAIADIKLEEVDNASVAAPMTSRSLDDVSDLGAAEDDDDDIVTDAAAAAAATNVCGICRLDFDNRSQLSSHELSCKAENYDLRRNPKRSRRFIDQDQHDIPYAVPAAVAAAASLLPPRPRFSFTAADDELYTCTFCGKEFPSSKALYGHLRCHPDRNHRGIPKPKVVEVKLEETIRVDRLSTHQEQQGGGSQESQTESEEENVRARREALGKAKAVVGPADDSDEESMEAAMGFTPRQEATEQKIDQQVSSSRELRMPPPSDHPSTSLLTRRKRSKRNGFRVRVPNMMMMMHETEDEENLVVKEAAQGLMLLFSLQEAALVISERVVPDEAREPEASELAGNDENAAAGGLEEGALRGEQGEGREDDGAGDHGAIIYRFQCKSCKKKFKNHQALGGHRASHNRIKGCHAQDASSDGVQDQEIVSDDRFPSNSLPSEIPDLSKREEGVETDRQLSTTFSNTKEESTNHSSFGTAQSGLAEIAEDHSIHESQLGQMGQIQLELSLSHDNNSNDSQLVPTILSPIVSVARRPRVEFFDLNLPAPDDDAPDDDDSEGNGSNRTPATVLLDSLGNGQCALSFSL